MAVNEGARESAESFIATWRGQWPEWRIAEVFIPPAQRLQAAAWLSLLASWTDAAQTAEPAPGLAKLAWWQEELHGWSRGARRHPLGLLLQKQPVDWAALAMALPGLMRRAESFDPTALTHLAKALAMAETALFADKAAADNDEAASLVGLQLTLGLAASAPQQGQGGVLVRRLMNALHATRKARQKAPISPWATLCCSWRAARAAGRP